MIIQCINCNKNFEVSSSLIPETGRNIQCGSCNHSWFFTHIDKTTSLKDLSINGDENVGIIDTIEDKEINLNQETDESKKLVVNKKNLFEPIKKKSIPKVNKSTNFNFSKILSYPLVGIISFIALVILLDTFKSPLSDLFPGLELLLYNLFESIKDMFLFFENLIR